MKGRTDVLELVKGTNLTLRFLLELCAVGALGYWGFESGGGWAAKIALGLGAPLLAAVVWGTLVSPKAPVQVSVLPRLLLELAVFGAAAAALYASGHPGIAWMLIFVYAINRALIHVLDR